MSSTRRTRRAASIPLRLRGPDPLTRYKSLLFYSRAVLPRLQRVSPLADCEVMIALTNRCQCRCPHCGAHSCRKARAAELKSAELKSAEIKALISEMARLGAGAAYFFGGEPLLHPDLPEFSRHARSLGLRIRLDTNGYLLDDRMVRSLKESGVGLVGISLDSPDASRHDSLRGVPGLYKRVMAGHAACRRHGLPAYFSTYATHENLNNGELRRLVKLALGLGAGVRIMSSICSGRWLRMPEKTLSPGDLVLLRGLLQDRVCWETDLLIRKQFPFACMAIWRRMIYITAHGDVQPCCFVPLVCGNIRKQPLEKIIRRVWALGLDKFSHVEDCLMNCAGFRSRHPEIFA